MWFSSKSVFLLSHCRSRLLESEAMASAVARRSVMSASRMRGGSIEAPESILELAKQDLSTQMQKAKVQYKYGHRDYNYTYNLNLQSSFSLRDKNDARDTRNTRASRVGYPRNSSRVERPASNTRESRAKRDKFKPANRFTKGPAPRCHGKAFKHENWLTRGINKVKKSLFGLKVVPRRLAAQQNQAKKCLNGYGFGTRKKPGTESKTVATRLATTSRPGARATASKIPVPVSGLSRRSLLMDDIGYRSTSRGQYGTMKDNVDCLNNRRSCGEDRVYYNSPRPGKTGLSGSGYDKTIPPGGDFNRRDQNPREALSSYSKNHAPRSASLWDEASCGRKPRPMKYPNRYSTGTLEAYQKETAKQLIPHSDDVVSGEGPGDSWESFRGKSSLLQEKHASSSSGQNRKQQNIRPNLIGLNPKTSREFAVISADSPMSSHGSWEGYECENEATTEHVRPLSATSQILRPISENVRPKSDYIRPSSENLQLTSYHRQPTSENIRPLSLELDEKAMSLPERRSRLEKDLDALMETMEKVLGSPVSPSCESIPGSWPRKMSRKKPKLVMLDRPVFEAVI